MAHLKNKTVRWVLTAWLGAMCAFAPLVATAQDAPLVAFTAIVEHPALDAVREGALEALAARGYKAGSSMRTEFESAQGQMVNAAQIAERFVGQDPAVIVGISTPSAQAALSATTVIPIVFSAVTDPVAAGLVVNMEVPGGNVTGVSDMSPVANHISLAQEIVPGLTRLGVVYNPGEANSVSLIKITRAAASAAGIELVEAGANRTADLAAAVESLVGKVDAVYAPTDNVVASGLEALLQTAHENGIPTIAGDVSYVERGAVAGSGFDYKVLGRLTGGIIADILEGADPGTIPVVLSGEVDLAVNVKSAAMVGIELRASLLDRAAFVYE